MQLVRQCLLRVRFTVCGKSTYRMQLDSHAVLVTVKPDGIGTIDESASRRSLGLEAAYHEMALRAPDIVLEMVKNAAAQP